jgi:hypothetical protein
VALHDRGRSHFATLALAGRRAVLSEDIDRLQNVVIPGLVSKRTEVEAFLR